MTVGPSFEADPVRINALAEETRAAVELARAIASEFSAAEERTAVWPGDGDDYSRQARLQAERERDFMDGSLTAAADGVEAVIAAHFQEARVVNNASGFALDSYDQLKAEMDAGDAFDGGSGGSGGKN